MSARALALAIILAVLFACPAQCASFTSFNVNTNNLPANILNALPRSSDGRRAYAGDTIIYLDRVRHKAAIGGTLWPKGEIIYQFSGQTEPQRQTFRDACAAWTVGTALRCLERTTQSNYIEIITHDGSGCGGKINVSCSAVGMIGGRQHLEVYTNHWFVPYVLQHEIGHALGLIHEQSRPDRDRFVIINSANIQSGAGFNFRKEDDASAVSDYDYVSIMHYSNCAFAIRPYSCDPDDRATEPNWTISPAPCSLNRVGGEQITALDLEGIRRAYGGAILALFEENRRQECGNHVYSRDQVVQTCGANCTMAGPVTWSRIHERYDWGCGWIPVFNGPGYCAGRKQEFKDQWGDTDWPSGKCWGGTLVERWTACGCTSQTMKAQCTDFSSSINLNKLEALVNSPEPAAHHSGLLIKALLWLSSLGYFTEATKTDLPKVMLASYVRRDPIRTAAFLCELKVNLTLRRLFKPTYQMDARTFMQLASSYSLD